MAIYGTDIWWGWGGVYGGKAMLLPEASPNRDQFLKLQNEISVYVIYMCLNVSILIYHLAELKVSEWVSQLLIIYNKKDWELLS